MRQAEAGGLSSKFQAPSGNRTWDLAMEGLLHTTELDRLYKPQALSPRLPPLPPFARVMRSDPPFHHPPAPFSS